MLVTMPMAEAIALATAARPLPPAVLSVSAERDEITADVDPRLLPGAPAALRWAAVATGAVTVTARLVAFADGVASLEVRTHARAVPLHVLVNVLADHLTGVLRDRGLDAHVTVRRGEGVPVVDLHLQRAIAQRADGVVLTRLELADARILLELAIANPVLRDG